MSSIDRYSFAIEDMVISYADTLVKIDKTDCFSLIFFQIYYYAGFGDHIV